MFVQAFTFKNEERTMIVLKLEEIIKAYEKHLAVDEVTLDARRKAQDKKGWEPAKPRKRKVSTALKAYAKLTTSAAKGAVRQL